MNRVIRATVVLDVRAYSVCSNGPASDLQNTGVQFSETTASTGTPILRWPSDFPVPSLLHRDFILATFIFHVSGIVYPYVIAHVTQKLQIHRFL